MFKNKFKKLTGLFLAAVMTLVALPIQTLASDWGVGDNVYAAMLGNYIGSDGKPYADKYNYDYIYYKSDGSVGVATRYASTHAKLGISKNGVTQQAMLQLRRIIPTIGIPAACVYRSRLAMRII
mgnify:CR=1 FL=1